MFVSVRRVPAKKSSPPSLVCSHVTGYRVSLIRSKLIKPQTASQRGRVLVLFPSVRTCCVDEELVQALFWLRVNEALDKLQLDEPTRREVERDLVRAIRKPQKDEVCLKLTSS